MNRLIIIVLRLHSELPDARKSNAEPAQLVPVVRDQAISLLIVKILPVALAQFYQVLLMACRGEVVRTRIAMSWHQQVALDALYQEPVRIEFGPVRKHQVVPQL